MRGILLFLLFPSVLFAQSTLPKGENRFSRLSIEDGLSQMGVLDILQDRKGFVWIATRDGLNRYDGQNFVVYRKKRGDTTSLNHNRIWSLAQSDGGNVWVGTNYGLAKFSYQTNRFSRFVPFPGQPYDLRNTIRAILCLHDGRLLVGTENGALVFDSGTGTFDVQTLEETAGSFVKDFLLVRESQEVYVATNRGLFQYNQNLELERHYLNLLPDQERTTPIQVHALYQDTQDRIWVGTEKGVHQYHADQGHFSYFHNPLADEGTFPVLDIEEDEHGTLWIAASYLYSFEEDHYEAYYPHDPADETSISGNYVTCITKSSDGVLWMGSDRFGVNIFNPAAYPFEYMGQYATADRGLGNSFVTAIQPTPDGKVLVGTATTLDLISIETERRYRSHQNPLPLGSNPLWVLDILPHKNGSQYWLATMIGVGLYDYPTGTITYPLADQLGHRVNRVEALNQDELLVSTHGAGLYRYNYERDQLTKITSENPQHVNLAQGLVRSTLVVGDSVWIGTERGLYLYHLPTGAVQQFVHDPTDSTSLPEDYIKHIFQDRSGTLWLGTWGGGIAKLLPESQTFVTYGLDQGLPNQVVYGILQDEAGYLWCSSNVGISRFDPVKEEFLNFDAEDGLQGNEFNTGAFHQAEDGTLFFGGVNGFNWFDPTDIQPISSPPTTVITEFYLDNKLVEPGSNSVLQRNILETDTVILNWRQNNFAVRVAALDYASNQPNTFRYCLDGHETLWRSLGSLDYFNYTSIDPGWYTLQVQAASRNGVWAPESRKLVIHITEPFWRNRGVQVGAIALFVGLLFFLNYLYIRNRRWRTEQLENMVLERTRTIQEQKEELGTAHQEMEQQNVELQRAAENLETSNEELRQLKSSLEFQVQNRTAELMTANQELAEQNSQLEQFAFITAHNLKAPISQFQGLLSIFPPAHTFDDYTRELISRLHGSAEDLKGVVTDLNLILDIKKGVGHEFNEVNLIEHLNKVVKSLRPEANKKNVSFILPSQKSVPILGFPPYVHSILHNLIHNSIKYSASGRDSWVRVSIAVKEELVEVIVEDNGIGIDMDKAKDKVFKLYQRFNTTHPGKGFGLFLVKTQVEAMGGSVSLSSEPDTGSAIYLHFIRMPEMPD